eukprot:TRINITY_DN7164_c0_g1_i1.p1 TRINITY_DN7164_c0_g1~~TRINITY_DN7164_c0_g1_i1.p1  ORF type:complete len:1474 (+),score=291.29 TRINITY_DN7164_c0_g1_i1:61-4482(+)
MSNSKNATHERVMTLASVNRSIDEIMTKHKADKDQPVLPFVFQLQLDLKDLKPDSIIDPTNYLNAIYVAAFYKREKLLVKLLQLGQKLVENEIIVFTNSISHQSPRLPINNPLAPLALQPGDILGLEGIIDMFCSLRRFASESIIGEMLKFMSLAVSASCSEIHDDALMEVVKTSYTLSISTIKGINVHQVAKTSLLQVTQSIAYRMEAGATERRMRGSFALVPSSHIDDEDKVKIDSEANAEVDLEEPAKDGDDEPVVEVVEEEEEVHDEIAREESTATSGGSSAVIETIDAKTPAEKASVRKSVLEIQLPDFDDFTTSEDQAISQLPPLVRDLSNVMITFCRILSRQRHSEKQEEFDSTIEGQMIAIEVLLSLVEERGSLMESNEDLLHILRVHVCPALVHPSTSDNPIFFRYSLIFFYLLVERFRYLLKDEIGILLSDVYLPLLENPVTPDSHKMQLMLILNQVCKSQSLLVEMYLNYDCELMQDNVFERFAEILSKIARSAFPKFDDSDAQMNFEEFGCQALVDVLGSLYKWSKLGPQKKDQLPSDVSASYGKLSLAKEDLIMMFEKKKKDKIEYAKAIELFNLKASRGINHGVEKGVLEHNPASIAMFLRSSTLLDKSKIGEYLGEGEDFNIEVLRQFVDTFSFHNMAFVDALRHFLASFRLPGEAQKISRVLEFFTARYCLNNPGVFRAADTAFVLSYSIIMLNTDAHNPTVKKKMTSEEFVKNNRGIDGGQDLPPQFLVDIYTAISKNEIRMKDVEEPKLAAGVSTTKKRAVFFAWETARLRQKACDSFLSRLRSAENASFYKASYADFACSMFSAIWHACIGAFSQAVMSKSLETPEDTDKSQTLGQAFKRSIQLATKYRMETELSAFVTTFTKLFSPVEPRVRPKSTSGQSIYKRLSRSDVQTVDPSPGWDLLQTVSRFTRGEGTKLQENLDRLWNLEKSLVGCSKLFDPSKRIILESRVNYIDGEASKERYVFLLNDSLIIATSVPNPVSQLYIYHRTIPLLNSVVKNMTATAGFANMIEIEHPSKKIVINLPTKEAKSEWLEDVSKLISRSSEQHIVDLDGKTHLHCLSSALSSLNYEYNKHVKGELCKRVVQLDFSNRKFNFIKKGSLRKTFGFAKLEDCVRHDENPFLLQMVFKGNKRRPLQFDVPEQRDEVYYVCKDIVDANAFLLPPKLKPGECVKRGSCEKQGSRAWADRYILLFKRKMYIYKTAQEYYPVNILDLAKDMTVTQNEETVLHLQSATRRYELRFKTTAERDGWEIALASCIKGMMDEALNPSLLTCTNSMSFMITKLNKRGIAQNRILQIDFDKRVLFNILDGTVRKSWALSEIGDCQAQGQLCLLIFFKDFHRYEVYAQTKQDFDDMFAVLQLAIKATTDVQIPVELSPGLLLRRGYNSQQHNIAWSTRMTYLFEKRLYTFKNDFEKHPISVIQMRDVKSLTKPSSSTIEVKQKGGKILVMKFENEV